MGIVIGIVFIGLGIASFAKRDWWWGLTEWSNGLRGVESSRTDRWDYVSSIQGVFLIIVGIVLILFVR